MLSQTTEYALRTITWLSAQDGEPRTAKEIAAVTSVPQGYLSKVLQTLVKAGLVSSQRGLNGGYLILKKPTEISVLEVINVIDPFQRITTCPLGKEHSGKELCPLHAKLDAAVAEIEAVFAETMVSELHADSASGNPLCGRDEG